MHLDPYAVLDNALQEGIENAVYELEYFKAHGGNTIIDCTLDEIGREFYVNKERRFAYDLERIQVLKELLDEGYGDKILVCNDICLKSMRKQYGGLGYAHILRGVKQMALENGIDENTYLSLLTKNVKNFIK